MAGLKYGISLYCGAEEAAEIARLGEEAGWDGIFLGDAIWLQDLSVVLAAMAVATERVRLGTMVIPVPLRKPWKIAGESVALDILSKGRLTLGLGTGAVWMGWQAFPDVVTDVKARAEMLDETVDILTLLYQRKQFDFDGKHYHLKLTLLDEMHYPPKPVQQPRIPLWVVGVWPRMKSMRRILKCDGLLPLKMNAEGQFEEVTPADLRQMSDFIQENRSLDSPFDIVVEGNTDGMGNAEIVEKLTPWLEAGATWWIEGMWQMSGEQLRRRIKQGPPRIN